MSKCSIAVSALVSTVLLAGCGAGSNVLRVAGGPLAPCTGGPHCVSSTDPDPDYRIAPIQYLGTVDAAKARIKAVVTLQGAEVVSESQDYLHAAYTTSLMRYVDDVEFVFAQPGRIELRSSSRIGYADMGTNRERTEAIRAAFAAGQ